MTDLHSIALRAWKWLSGLGLATILLVLLGVQTWLATLEMVHAGLLATLQKYFHWTSWLVLAELPLPGTTQALRLPLPGGYWVCALLLVNMTLGGLIHIRKGWKRAGVMMAHFGIIFMVAAGGVAQLLEKRGVMFLFEGEQADFAVSLTDPTIEIIELDQGRSLGPVHVASADTLRGMGRQSQRTLRFPRLPLDLELRSWVPNVLVVPEGRGGGNPVIDGWTLRELPLEKEGELNAPGCYARVIHRDGSRSDPFILAVPPPSSGIETFAPYVIQADGRRFAIRMVKETIPVPYTIRLKKAVAEYYPNSQRPKSFMSEIERIDEETIPVDIRMNEPMRRGGFTFFQRTMSSGPQAENGPKFSGFEVVANPADRWPEWSLYIVAAGLGIHFLTMLVTSTRRRKPTSQAS